MSELLKDTELPTIVEDNEEIQKMFCQWIMFSTVGRGKREYLCSRCGGKWTHQRHELKETITPEDRFWDEVKINDRVECPKCGCVSLVKNRKTFTPAWREKGIVYLFPIAPDYVVARCVLYEKYGKNGEFTENLVRRSETNIYHFRENQKTVFFAVSKLNGKLFEQKHITEPFHWWHGMWNEDYGYTALCMPYNGMEVKKDTFLKYFPEDQLGKKYDYERHYPAMKLTAAYAQHPRQVETLAKVGKLEAISALTEGTENVRILDWNALTPWAIHRLGKQEYEVWTKHCYSSLDYLKLYRFIGKEGVNGMRQIPEIVQRINAMTYRDGLKEQKKIISMGKSLNGKPDGFISYIEKLTDKYNEKTCLWGHVSERDIYSTWCDYRETAKKLHCEDKVPMFPHDLKDRHDRLVAEWRVQEEQRRRAENIAYRKAQEARQKQLEEAERRRREELELRYKGVRERYAQIAERYAYSDGVYSIVVPQGAADIQKEGYNLFHCTGTTERYFQRIISGESYIFFLRRADKPEESWYTLEVEPGGTIRQKRTMYDRQEEDLNEAVPFLRKWQEMIAPRMNEDDLRAAMESKRLRLMEFEELRRTDTRIRNGQMKGQRLADVLTEDLMEVLWDQKTGAAAVSAKEVKKA